MKSKTASTINILLGEDDIDDRNFFKKAISLISKKINLTIMNDGMDLMEYLEKSLENLPNVIFLDISMPRKTGIECLAEIFENEALKALPIIMLTTSYSKDENYERQIIDTMLRMGAKDFLRKPESILSLKLEIENVLNNYCKT